MAMAAAGIVVMSSVACVPRLDVVQQASQACGNSYISDNDTCHKNGYGDGDVNVPAVLTVVGVIVVGVAFAAYANSHHDTGPNLPPMEPYDPSAQPKSTTRFDPPPVTAGTETNIVTGSDELVYLQPYSMRFFTESCMTTERTGPMPEGIEPTPVPRRVADAIHYQLAPDCR